MTVILFACVLLFMLWFSVRYAWWRRPVDYGLPRILMYHMISEPVPGAKFNGLRVSPRNFESQLRWLKSDGWRFSTVSEVVSHWHERQPKTVVLTFDDGYADNLESAMPLLEKYDAKATLYLVVDRHDREWSSHKKAHHNSGELMGVPKLTDKQVAEMVASGRVELASHTITHPNMNKLDDNAVSQEVIESKRILEEAFSVEVSSFAYPFGIYDERAVQQVRDAGYKSAVTTNPGIDVRPDFYQLKRVKISGKDNLLAFKLRMRTGLRGLFK